MDDFSDMYFEERFISVPLDSFPFYAMPGESLPFVPHMDINDVDEGDDAWEQDFSDMLYPDEVFKESARELECP